MGPRRRSHAPIAAAQTEEVDVAEFADTVLEVDPEALVEGLEDAPADDQLPEGFINPPSGTPTNEEIGEAFQLPLSDLEGSIANVNFTFDTDPDVIEGLISSGFLNYIVLEEEATPEMLEGFKAGVEEGIESNTDESPEFAVEDIDVGGADAVLITVSTSQSGVSAVVQMVAVPVGNVFVLGSALVADQEVDVQAVQTHAEDLTLAGVAYLGEIAEDA